MRLSGGEGQSKTTKARLSMDDVCWNDCEELAQLKENLGYRWRSPLIIY